MTRDIVEIFLPYILSTMGYLLMVLKVSYRWIIYASYCIPFLEMVFQKKIQVGRISAVEYIENSLIWKSSSSCVEWRFQKFVQMNFHKGIASTIFQVFMKNLSIEKMIVLNIFHLWLPKIVPFRKVIIESDRAWNSLQLYI